MQVAEIQHLGCSLNKHSNEAWITWFRAILKKLQPNNPLQPSNKPNYPVHCPYVQSFKNTSWDITICHKYHITRLILNMGRKKAHGLKDLLSSLVWWRKRLYHVRFSDRLEPACWTLARTIFVMKELVPTKLTITSDYIFMIKAYSRVGENTYTSTLLGRLW